VIVRGPERGGVRPREQQPGRIGMFALGGDENGSNIATMLPFMRRLARSMAIPARTCLFPNKIALEV